MKKYKFRFQILLMNISVISFIVIAFLVVFLIYYSDGQAGRRDEELENAVENINKNISSTLEMLDSIALQLSTNNYIVGVFKELPNQDAANYFKSEVAETKTIHEFMWSYILKQNTATRVCVYNDNGDFVYSGNAVDNSPLKEYIRDGRLLELKDAFSHQNKKKLYLKYDKDPLTEKDNTGYISIVREIKEYPLLNEKTLGYVEVQLSLSALDKVIFPKSDKDFSYLKDMQTGNIISRSTKRFNQIPKGRGYYEKSSSLNDYGLTVVVVRDNKEQTIFVRNVMISIVIIIIFLIAGVYLIQRRILIKLTQPLVNLCDSVKQIEFEQVVNKKFQECDYDEFARITAAFDQMLLNLKKSMDEVVLSKTSEVKAQMYALQAQMDPHFIHNTIAVIGALADEGEDEKITDVCEKLSEMIRYSGEFTGTDILLTEEVQYAINYMELMKVRYEENFSYEINFRVDREIRIPKFILQPLVENCFKHGFKKKSFPWNIKISCFEDENQWYLEVTDNGIGISSEHKNRILNKAHRMQDAMTQDMLEQLRIGGLSLQNVTARLYLYYHEDMIFQITEEPQGGTRVCIGGAKL